MTSKSLVPVLCLAAAACTMPVAIPETLEPGANATLAMVVPAKGTQIYECRAKKDASGAFEWAFVAPDAELYDVRGNVIGKHGAGPYWQSSDGSRIAGTVKTRADAPVAGAIPWLLLSTTSTGPEGSFSRVTSIQRVNTVGGLPPPNPCSGESLGRQARIPYTADYRFFTPQR